jgi:hypothetical protein
VIFPILAAADFKLPNFFCNPSNSPCNHHQSRNKSMIAWTSPWYWWWWRKLHGPFLNISNCFW